MRCRSGTPRKAWRRCASAAAWASRCVWKDKDKDERGTARADDRSSSYVQVSPDREERMARVAVVTGGTRGIGAAISKALKAAGCTVAANYGGNDAAAQKFKSETGIPVYKWDVSSYDACAAGLKQVEADLGPV